jgi:Fe-S-cluster containining protein
LTRKVDAFFARVADRHGTDMQCATGCSDCCHVRLSITAVEAAAIRDHVAGWSAQERRNLAEFGVVEPGSPSADRCAALDPAGRCKIYDARPLVCRSHGVPIRLRHGALPVVQACHRNFRHTTPDRDCVLDQTTLSAMLLAVDVAESPGSGGAGAAGPPGEPGPRVELARLLAELAAI